MYTPSRHTVQCPHCDGDTIIDKNLPRLNGTRSALFDCGQCGEVFAWERETEETMVV